jgi:putative tryptophan/tyrosine transport system substrate-binding protein
MIKGLVAACVDVILTSGYAAAAAAKEFAPNIPVVAAGTGDPVAAGLVQSLAQPGGHLTGVSEVAAALSAKRLQLLKETVPSVHSVAVLWNADDLAMSLHYQAAEVAAKKHGMVIVPLGVRAPDDFETAFAAMNTAMPEAILMVTGAVTSLNRKRVIEFAAEHHLPSIFEYAFLAHNGGLLAYGGNLDDIFDRAVGLADRVLRGASPAVLLLELPTRFQFSINPKTAAALGRTIRESIELRADDVIE